ncbi:MAG: hypothetical protein CM1200mP39_21820 [Dehalococcoidia bacterium]|nr:MAG: hypothetical protein CM1200mP39_21820 [Dehalococcoidia bacterium]
MRLVTKTRYTGFGTTTVYFIDRESTRNDSRAGVRRTAFHEEMLPKITELREKADRIGTDLEIAVDGGIKVDTASEVINAGATTLISGTGVFDFPDGPKIGIKALRNAGN